MITLLLALSLALNGILYLIYRWERADKNFWYGRTMNQARSTSAWHKKYMDALRCKT